MKAKMKIMIIKVSNIIKIFSGWLGKLESVVEEPLSEEELDICRAMKVNPLDYKKHKILGAPVAALRNVRQKQWDNLLEEWKPLRIRQKEILLEMNTFSNSGLTAENIDDIIERKENEKERRRACNIRPNYWG